MLLLTVFCIFSVLSLTSATQSFKHIKSLINEVESLPVVHQHDLWGFVETYLEPGTGRDRRRVYEESHPDGFFHLKSVVSLNDEVESHFVMKPVVFRPDVHENGKPVRVDLGHTFNGYSSDDIGTIIVLHVPSSSQVEGGSHPMEAVSGMVHHSNGRHSSIQHSPRHGIVMKHFNISNDPTTGCKGGLHHHDNHAVHHKQEAAKHHKEAQHVFKRSIEEAYEAQLVEEVEANGLSEMPLVQIEIVVMSDVAFSKYFPSGSAAATSYVAKVLSATNAIYERDFYGTLVFQHFGFYTANAPVNSLDDLATWLGNNPSIDAKSDVATVLQGGKEGGLGYVGTLCGSSKTSECGVNAKYGTADPGAPNDLLVVAHEIGHVLGSSHTHDADKYTPVIDRCGTSLGDATSIPPDGGSIMSYCHAVLGGSGFGSINFFMGAVGQYGVNSERVNKVIRAKVDAGACLSSADPTWAPTCTDYTPYVWTSGEPIVCSDSAAYCTSGLPPFNPPYCQKTCGRCVTTTTPVNGAIPLGAPTNCVWNDWGAWSLCTKACGTGTRESSRTVKTAATNGGAPCNGGTTRSENCNTQACSVPVDCAWTTWSAWTSCSASCGTGTRSASRSIATPSSGGGLDCSGGTTRSESCNTQACLPTNCQWNSWGAWGSCSATCGAGSQTRTRTILATPTNGGTACAPADATQIQSCTGTSCPPVNCAWGAWSAWTTCSSTCGTGTRTATRTVTTAASNGGTACNPADGTKSEACNTQSCATPINCAWGAWSAWGTCSTTCGAGTQTRTRNILTPAQNGGVDCNSNASTSSQDCNLGACDAGCVWAAWGAWSSCTASCGTGTRTSTRKDTASSPSCLPEGGTRSELCNTQSCPVDCVWGSWSAWSICNKECGGGTQISTRPVTTQGANGGKACVTADGTKSQNCNTQACSIEPSVNCQWGAWSAWSTCSVPCGDGVSTRTRTIAVQSSGTGTACGPNDGAQSNPCNLGTCSSNCVWSDWSNWGSCDKTCGTGARSQTRTIVKPSSGTGTPCNPNDSAKFSPCNTQPCNCGWGAWSDWSQCSKLCNTGSRVRSRAVTQPATTGGIQCSSSDGTQTSTCNTQACTTTPVNCAWSTWSAWSTCSKTCGGGTRTATRTIATPSSNGGTACTGASLTSETCNTQKCPPTNCVWGAWAAWGSCSQSCGTGTRLRTRNIVAEATNGGAACKAADSTSSQACNTQACKATDCLWGQWSAWGFCSKVCGSGVRARNRPILAPASLGGKACNNGDAAQSEACNTQDCVSTAVPCIWSEWSAWSDCSAPCDRGIRFHTRTVLASSQNGGDCLGEDTAVEECNTQECPIPPECSDEAIDLPVTREGEPITCKDEALRGNCLEWYNYAPNCMRSCGWNNCPIPCDDEPNPAIEAKDSKGAVIKTCPEQAAEGLCDSEWMTERACRQSCGKCGRSRVVPRGGSAVINEIESNLEWEETARVFDQGTNCTLNKGMPSFEVDEAGAPHGYVIAADDFTVAAGKTIFLDQIHLATRWTPLPNEDIPEEEQPLIQVRVTVFYNTTVRCRMVTHVLPKPLLRLEVAPFRCFLLGAYEDNGQLINADQKYWLSISSFTEDLGSPLLYWGFAASPYGEPFLWKDPADYFGHGKCPKWREGEDCGVDTYGSDLCFRFLGYESNTKDADRYYLASLPLSSNEDGDFIGSDNRETGYYSEDRAKGQDDQGGAIQDNLDLNRVTYGGPTDIDLGDINDLEFLAYVIPLAAFFTVFTIVCIMLGIAAWKRAEIIRLWSADDYQAFSDFE